MYMKISKQMMMRSILAILVLILLMPLFEVTIKETKGIRVDKYEQ
jgi:hypothetical protein